MPLELELQELGEDLDPVARKTYRVGAQRHGFHTPCFLPFSGLGFLCKNLFEPRHDFCGRLVHTNGILAICLGHLGALLGLLLYCLNALPGLDRGGGEQLYCAWCLPFGLGFSVLGLLFPSCRSIFLDSLCSSRDPRRAVASLASTLKRSDSMLVAWDSTTSHNLWCLFEIVSFLKTRNEESRPLVIKPTFMGPFSIAVFLGAFFVMVPYCFFPVSDFVVIEIISFVLAGLGVICASCAMHFLFQSADETLAQLKNSEKVSLQTCICSCCKEGQEKKHLCDKEVITECIRDSYSIESFEEVVRFALHDAVKNQCRGTCRHPAWILAVGSPLLWANLDMVATFAEQQDPESAVAFLIYGLVSWLVLVPAVIFPFVFICDALADEGSSTFRELLRTFGPACVPMSLVFSAALTLKLSWGLAASPLGSAGAGIGICVGVWAGMLLCGGCCFSCVGLLSAMTITCQ